MSTVTPKFLSEKQWDVPVWEIVTKKSAQNIPTVTPKLLYLSEKHCDVPVWEIVTKKGRRFYYERVNRPGYRPIGVLGSSTVRICDVVKRVGNKSIIVLKEKDDFIAPMSWYEPVSETQSGDYSDDNNPDCIDYDDAHYSDDDNARNY